MSNLFDNALTTILEAYGVLRVAPTKMALVPGSHAEKALKNPELKRGFDETNSQFETLAKLGVWEKMRGREYANRVGDPKVITVLKLKGKNSPRAIGKLEGDTFYVYWIGTHEEFNRMY